MLSRTKLSFLGVGNMASAILNGVLDSGVFAPSDIILFDILQDKLSPYLARGCQSAASLSEAVQAADAVLLCVKPQQITTVMDEIRPYAAGKLVVSIAAGVTIAQIAAALPKASVVRVMPNTPLLVGEGVSALCRDLTVSSVSEEDFALAFRIFSASGMAVELSESLMNPVTALTSSSIAYFARFIGNMYAWAIDNGLPEGEQTLTMVCRSAIGTARMLAETEHTPSSLEKAVTSPGGTTAEAMKVFTEQGLDTMIPLAMDACRNRADELAKR